MIQVIMETISNGSPTISKNSCSLIRPLHTNPYKSENLKSVQ